MPAFDKTVDQFNLGLGVLLCVLLFSVLFLKYSSPGYNSYIISPAHKAEAELPVLNLAKKSDKYYERILGRRELFVAQPGLELKKAASLSSEELPNQIGGEDLQLMGIVSGAQGPQAILMDPKTGKSFYCSGGEKINGFTVINVMENKVILEIDGQSKEIKL